MFRTAGKGWGVRSPRSIPIGAYVCSYIGVVLTEKKAEAKWKIRDGDEYLFNLDHFTQVRSGARVRLLCGFLSCFCRVLCGFLSCFFL